MSDVQTAENQATVFDLRLVPGADTPLTDEAIRNRDILIDAYKRILDGNGDALFEICDPDVEFHEAEGLPYGTSQKGIEGTRAGVAGMFGAWKHLRCDFSHFVTAGDLVIAYFRMIGTSRHSGEVYDAPGAELWRFRNGKVVEWRPIYWDTLEVRKVCGLT